MKTQNEEHVPKELWPRRGWFLVVEPGLPMAGEAAHYFAPDATGVYSLGERMSYRRMLRPWVLPWDIGRYPLCRRCRRAVAAETIKTKTKGKQQP